MLNWVPTILSRIMKKSGMSKQVIIASFMGEWFINSCMDCYSNRRSLKLINFRGFKMFKCIQVKNSINESGSMKNYGALDRDRNLQ